jgi:hypothetical protein
MQPASSCAALEVLLKKIKSAPSKNQKCSSFKNQNNFLRNLFLYSEYIFWWKINIQIFKHISKPTICIRKIANGKKNYYNSLHNILQGADGGSEVRVKGVEAKWKKVLGVSMAIGRSNIHHPSSFLEYSGWEDGH